MGTRGMTKSWLAASQERERERGGKRKRKRKRKRQGSRVEETARDPARPGARSDQRAGATAARWVGSERWVATVAHEHGGWTKSASCIHRPLQSIATSRSG